MPVFNRKLGVFENTIKKKRELVPEKRIIDEFFFYRPAYEFQTLHREGLRHRFTGCTFHNVIPANPGRYRISHNARHSCPKQPHPNKTSTNMSRQNLTYGLGDESICALLGKAIPATKPDSLSR